MTPPLFLLPDLALDVAVGDRVALTGAEAHHAATVKRISIGEVVWLADGRGRLAEAVAVATGRDQVEFEVRGVRFVARPELRFTVVQALPKGDRGELAVELLTELGVDEIVPWAAAHCVTQWRDKADRGVAKWRRTALTAAKQSRRARLPEVAELVPLAGVLDRVAAADVAVVLESAAAASLSEISLPTRGGVLIIVGPEGGISPAELDALVGVGARPVRLGPEVLRTSTAGPAALAALAARTGRWS